jgi:hypothetical protein
MAVVNTPWFCVMYYEAARPAHAAIPLCDIHLISPLKAYLTGTFWTNCDLTFQRQDDKLTYV